MYARKPRFPSLWLVILLLAVAVSLIAVAVGKYIKTTSYTGTFSVKAALAENLSLLESRADKQPDGSYVLDPSVAVMANEYDLIPGLDIPKDPYVQVINKTAIEAYLFIEVVDTIGNPAVTYQVDEAHWLPLGITGKHGGKVYVYSTDKTAPTVVDETVPTNPITVDGVQKMEFRVNILEGNTVNIGQKLLSDNTGNDMGLEFYACMGEVASSAKANLKEKAIEVYQKLP